MSTEDKKKSREKNDRYILSLICVIGGIISYFIARVVMNKYKERHCIDMMRTLKESVKLKQNKNIVFNNLDKVMNCVYGSNIYAEYEQMRLLPEKDGLYNTARQISNLSWAQFKKIALK